MPETIDLTAKFGADVSGIKSAFSEMSSGIEKIADKFESSSNRMEKSIDKAFNKMRQSQKMSLKYMDSQNREFFTKQAEVQSKAIATQMSGIQKSLTRLAQNTSGGAFKGIASSIREATSHSDGFFRTWWEISKNVFNVYMTFQALGSVIKGIVGPGFSFAKEMETMEIGTAGILMSMTQLDGKNLKWNEAMGISKNLMGKIADDALVTVSTIEELARTFQSVLAPAMSAGWNLDQVREFAKVGSNAVKAIGLPAQQVVQELRDLVNGGIRPSSSTLAASMGIDDAMVKKWKASGELFKNLMERMEGFKWAAQETQGTFAGLMSNIQDGIARVSSTAFAPLFAVMKDGLKQIQDLFFTIEKIEVTAADGSKFMKDVAVYNPQTLQFYRSLNDALVSLIESAKRFYSQLKGIPDLLKEIYNSFGILRNMVLLWASSFLTIPRLIAVIVFALFELKDIIIFVKEHIVLVTAGFVAWGLRSSIIFKAMEQSFNIIISKFIYTRMGIESVATGFTTAGKAAAICGAAIRTAMVTTVIGAVVVAIGYLVEAWLDFKRKVDGERNAKVGDVNSEGKVLKSITEEPGPVLENLSKREGREIRGKSRKVYNWDYPVAEPINPGKTKADYLAEQEAINNAKAEEDAKRLTAKFPVDTGNDKGADRAADANVKARLDALLEVYKLAQKKLDERKQDAEISITEYWQETNKITKDGIQARIDAEKELLLSSKDQAEVEKRNGAIAKLTTQLQEADLDSKKKYVKDLRAFNKEMASISHEYINTFGLDKAKSEGMNTDALYKFEAMEKYDTVLKQVTLQVAKLNKDGLDRTLTADEKATLQLNKSLVTLIPNLMKQYEAQLKLNDVMAQYEAKISIANTKLDILNQDVANGNILEINSYSQKRALLQEVHNALVAEKQAVIALAGTEANATDAQKLRLAQINLALKKNENEIQNTGLLTKRFMTDAFTNAFMSIINGTSSVADAFKNLANAIISELLRVIVVQRIVGALTKMMGFSGGGSVSPQGFYSVGDGKAWGGVVKKADGGPMGEVRGPGTSTSDSIPAWLSNGEYVIRAAAVQKMGIAKLDFLNKYGYLPTAKYASGGFASSNKKGASSSVGGGKSGGVDLENIRFEIINQTKEEVRMEQPKVAMDGTTMVISAFLTGLRNNTMGVRDVLTSSAGGRR